MTLRVIFLMTAALVVASTADSVFAEPEAAWICCDGAEDCPSGKVCCTNVTMGLEPCDIEGNPSYCVTTCIRPSGEGS